MDRTASRLRARGKFQPRVSLLEGRLLLSTAAFGLRSILTNPPGTQAIRPNTPVLPFGASLAVATFIDPSTDIINGKHTVLGQKSYIGPYVTLNSTSGFIKIGTGSDVLDNASIVSTPKG